VSASPDPEKELNEKIEGEDNSEKEIRSGVWYVIEAGVLEGAEVDGTLSGCGDIGCYPKSCWVDSTIELGYVQAINLSEVTNSAIGTQAGNVVL